MSSFAGSRENRSEDSASCVETDQSQIVITYGGERSGKLTLSRFTGDRNGQGVNVENTEEEGSESGFGELDNRECREEERITTAPGLEFGR